MRRTAALAALVVTLGACSRIQADAGPALVRELDQPLPVLVGTSVAGKPFTTAAAAGKVVVLNVWATWCTPCEQEQPDLVTVAKRYAPRGVVFLGVNARDENGAARSWIDRYHVPYPSLSDPAGRTAAKLSYVGLPDTYVVDRSGTIRYAINGQTSVAQLSGILDDVLGASASPSGA